MKQNLRIAISACSLFFAISITNAQAQATNSNWIKYGTNLASDGVGIGVDRFGNSYVGGYNTNDGGEINKYGYNSYYVAKYNPAGNRLWIRRGGAAEAAKHGFTFGHDITVDSEGNSYITGATDIGLSNQPQVSAKDYVVAKYSANGELLWSRQDGVPLSDKQRKANLLSDSQGNAISVDTEGNAYVVGTTILLPTVSRKSDEDYLPIQPDCFIAKYSSDGTAKWRITLDTKYACVNAKGISVDSNGNSYIAGIVHEGSTVANRRINYFIAKIDTNGKLAWFQRATDAVGTIKNNDAYPNTVATRISIDIDQNSYVSGYTNVGINSDSAQKGMIDGFVSKYDASGNMEWTHQIGAANGTVMGMGITVDKAGDSYVIGSTNVDISGQGKVIKEGSFIAKYAPDGKQLSLKQNQPQNGSAIGRAIATDSNGVSYATGLATIQSTNPSAPRDNYFIEKSIK